MTSIDEGESATVTVSRAASTSALTVNLSAVAGTGATVSDFSLSPSTLTFSSGQTSRTATITATNDNMDGPETKQVTVRARTSSSGYRNAPDTMLTINDNDASALTVVETGGSTAVTEGSTAGDAFTVALATEPRGANVAVAVSVHSDDTDECAAAVTGSTTYSATPGTLTFLPSSGTESVVNRMTRWNTPQLVTVRSVDDSIVDGDQTCRVLLDPSSPGQTGDSIYDGLMTREVEVTVRDNDVQPTLVLSDSNGNAVTSIDESGADNQATVTATLAAAAAGAVTITVSAAPGTNAVAGDYNLSSNTTLTIASGATASTGSVTITAVDNNLDAADKQVTVSATSSGGNTVNPAAVTLTITDDDTLGLVRSETALTVTEDAAGREDTFDVKLGTLPSATVTVTATAGSTQCQVKSGAGAFGASTALTFTTTTWDTDQTVTVRAVDDDIDDDSQDDCDITLATSSPGAGGDSDYDALTDVDVDVTVTDNDTAALTVSKSSVSTSEDAADPDANTDEFTVQLATQPTAMVTVSIAATGAGMDEASASPSPIRFAAAQDLTTDPAQPVYKWDDPRTVTVTGADDVVQDGSQAYTITVSATSSDTNYTGSGLDETVSGTNADDDTAGLIVSETAVSTTEPSGTDDFMVRLATAPTAEVTVSIAVTGGDTDEAAVSPSSIRFDAMASGSGMSQVFAWNADRTVTVTGQDDSVPDGARTYEITVSATSTDTNYSGSSLNKTVSGTNADDDAPIVTLSVSPGSVAEDGGTATVTASLNRSVGVATTVVVSAVPGTGAAAADFRLSENKTLTVAANQTSSTGEVTITAVDNNVYGPAEKMVTVSGTTSGGQGAADPTDATLTITDDEAAPTVSLSVADRAIWEDGGATAVSARLSHPSSEDTTVTVKVAAASSGIIALGADKEIVIPAGATTSPDTVSVAAVDNTQASNTDPVAALEGTASNSLVPGGLEVRDASLTVWDNETASVSLALEPERVAEGGTARVSAALTRPARTALTLTVSAMPGEGATAASFRLGAERTLSVAAGARASAGSVEIVAVDDEVDAPDRTVTVSVAVEGRARTPDPVALTIADDDETPRAMLVLTPAMIDESGAENMAAVTAALERPSSEATTITVSAQGMGFTQRGTALTIAAGSTASAGLVTLTAVDDDEQTPDREVRVSGMAANAHGVVQPEVAVLTIRDDDGTEAVTEVLLPEAARAMADSRATAVRRRLERAAAGEASDMPSLTAASALGLLAEHGASLQKDDLDWKTLLPRTSFALPLNAAGGDGAGGGVTVWGGGDYRDLDGEARGVKWDGEVSSAHLGADRLLANGMRLGVAASWSEAKFDYRHRNRGGDWELEMTSVQPYLGWTAANGIELWASAGAGSGDLDLDSGSGGVQSSDADMWLAAAGARGPLHLTEAGLQVSLRGEALYSSFEVDGNRGRIRGYTADASRLRLALEARRERVLESGARLSPRFELGVRHDGGDGETGAGVELGGGAEYAAGRLSVSGGARALVANSDYDEWGADFALAYAARADGRGLSFRLVPAWGTTQSGTQALWERGAPGLNGAAAETDPAARLEAELGYVLKSPWSRGTLQLTLGGEAGEDADAACRLRGAVALDATATLGLELEVRDPRTGGAERSLMVTGELRF